MSITRRTFIKSTSAALASMLIPDCLSYWKQTLNPVLSEVMENLYLLHIKTALYVSIHKPVWTM